MCGNFPNSIDISSVWSTRAAAQIEADKMEHLCDLVLVREWEVDAK